MTMRTAMQEHEGSLISMRMLPANLEAEQALLGALLASNRAYEQVSDFLRPEHFADGIHGAIFAAIQRRAEAGQLADAVTLRAEFEGSELLAPVGGVAYIARLLAAMVGVVAAGEYGRAIRDCWLRRQLVELGAQVTERAFRPDESDPDEQIQAAEAELLALAESGVRASPLVSSGEAAAVALAATERAMKSRGGLIGLDTGLRGVNRMTKGPAPGELWIVGARPSMGKTALGATIAYNVARSGQPVLFVTAEMSASAVMQRILAGHSGVPFEGVRTGHLEGPNGPEPMPQRMFDRLFEARREVAEMPLVFEERPSPSVSDIRGRARRMKRKGGLALVVVDYLGLMRASDIAARQGKRIAIGEISGGLKAMAKELQVPVIALSQLSRENEKREGKRPQLSDLRESGDLEQDADVVMFVHREHYYLAKNPPSKKPDESQGDFEMREAAWGDAVEHSIGRAELLLYKQRQGPTGIIRCRWDAETTWFRDDADHPAE